DAPRAEHLHQRTPVGLLVVRDAHHVDVDLEAEERAGEGERRAPLARARLGRDPLDALARVVVRLRDSGVRLVAARRRDALVLVEDPRGLIGRLLEPSRAVERRRAPLPVDGPDLLRDRDARLGGDLLEDHLHREERREVVGADGLAPARMEDRCRRLREVGGDVVPGLRQLALAQRVLHGLGHDGSFRSVCRETMTAQSWSRIETRSSSFTAYSAKLSCSSIALRAYPSATSGRPARACAQARVYCVPACSGVWDRCRSSTSIAPSQSSFGQNWSASDARSHVDGVNASPGFAATTLIAVTSYRN